MTVVVLTRDLMDGGRFRGVRPDVSVLRQLDAEVLGNAALVIVDLAGGFDLAAVAAVGPPVLAYGAHVDTDALDAALAAGCVDAVPRSRIFRDAAALIDKTLEA